MHTFESSNEEINVLTHTEPGRVGTEEALSEENVTTRVQKIASECQDEMVRAQQLQLLFSEVFADRLERVRKFTKTLPGNISIAVSGADASALKVEIEHAGDKKHFFVYPNGKVEGGIPKSWSFSKADLLEHIITAVDVYGDGFFENDTTPTINAEDVGLDPLLLEGEVVPPEADGIIRPNSGEGTILSRPEDPRRLAFYKNLPGVLCSFSGTINTRAKRFGSNGVPYRVYVFPKHIILDCSEVGNAILVRELDAPLQLDDDALARPIAERISATERARFQAEIWGPNFAERGKSALRNLGFARIYHPSIEEGDETYYEKYYARLAKHIDFSAYSPTSTLG